VITAAANPQAVATGGSLSRICSSCIDYYTAEDEDATQGIYSSLGPLNFFSTAAGTDKCDEYKTQCAQLLCDGCISVGAAPVMNSPIVFFADSPTCFDKLPICDDYLYSQQQLTCASTVLPEIGGCEPATIGNGVCDVSTQAVVACSFLVLSERLLVITGWLQLWAVRVRPRRLLR